MTSLYVMVYKCLTLSKVKSEALYKKLYKAWGRGWWWRNFMAWGFRGFPFPHRKEVPQQNKLRLELGVINAP